MNWSLVRKNKYSAKITELDGIKFHSKGEAACYSMLKLLERAGKVKILVLQDAIHLTRSRILYKPDFKILDLEHQKTVWIEFKGSYTQTWGIKKRLWKSYGPGTLRIYKAKGSTIYLDEEIESTYDQGNETK